MPYYRPIKTIASVAGLPGKAGGGGGVIIVSNVKPPTRDDGSELREGDIWYQPSTELTYLFVQGDFQVIGSNVDYGGDFIIDGGSAGGNGFIDNNPGDGTGGGGPPVEIDTSNLKLAFAGQNPFDNLRISDLPDASDLEFQSDANHWYLESIVGLMGDIEVIEKELENLNNVGQDLTFRATAPIVVEVGNRLVRHSFNLTNLTPIS